MNTKLKKKCARFLENLPPVDFAMVYGSSAFPQKGARNQERKQIDLILATKDSVAWHAENVKRNSKHYSFAKYFGPNFITRVQNSGPSIQFIVFHFWIVDVQIWEEVWFGTKNNILAFFERS